MTPVVELLGISRVFPGNPPVQAISNVDLRVDAAGTPVAESAGTLDQTSLVVVGR